MSLTQSFPESSATISCQAEPRKLFLKALTSALIELRQGPAATLSVWRARHYFRSELRRLAAVAPHVIVDIGLTPDQVLDEVARPFWRA